MGDINIFREGTLQLEGSYGCRSLRKLYQRMEEMEVRDEKSLEEAISYLNFYYNLARQHEEKLVVEIWGRFRPEEITCSASHTNRDKS